MAHCAICKREWSGASVDSAAFLLCSACGERVSGNDGAAAGREALDAIDRPVLLMQANPRQVVTANTRAMEIFGKDLSQIEARRGGDVFDCVHSFTPAGCGLDKHCAACRIKAAVVDAFATGSGFPDVENPLQVVKGNGTHTYNVRVSTVRAGEFVLLRIDQYQRT